MIDIDIDFNDDTLAEYRFYLCKPNRDTVGELYHIKDRRIQRNLGGVSELSFTVPMYITTDDGISEENKLFRLIRGQYLIRCEKGSEKTYFIVTTPQKSL